MSHIEPDIDFIVYMVSQHTHSLKEAHLEAIYKIFKYPKILSRRELFFKKDERKLVEIFIDAERASSTNGRRSTIEYCTFVWKNLVTWRSKKKKCIC